MNSFGQFPSEEKIGSFCLTVCLPNIIIFPILQRMNIVLVVVQSTFVPKEESEIWIYAYMEVDIIQLGLPQLVSQTARIHDNRSFPDEAFLEQQIR